MLHVGTNVETASRSLASSLVVTITGVEVEEEACCRLLFLSLLLPDGEEKGMLRMTPLAVPIHRRLPLAFSAGTGIRQITMRHQRQIKADIPVMRMKEKADLGESIFPT